MVRINGCSLYHQHLYQRVHIFRVAIFFKRYEKERDKTWFQL